MSLVVATCEAIKQRINGLVLLVHHTGKDVTKGSRGYTGLPAAVETSIEVTRTGNSRGWKLIKLRDSQDGLKHGFSLETVHVGFDEEGEPITSCVVNPIVNGAQESRTLPKSMVRLKAAYVRLNPNVNSLTVRELLTAAVDMHQGYSKANAKRDLATYLNIQARNLSEDRIISL